MSSPFVFKMTTLKRGESKPVEVARALTSVFESPGPYYVLARLESDPEDPLTVRSVWQYCPPSEALFKERTPEAAAIQMARVLATAVEGLLRTLDYCSNLKRFSKSELQRQTEWAQSMVRQVADLNVEPVGLLGQRCHLLHWWLKNSDKVLNGLTSAQPQMDTHEEER